MKLEFYRQIFEKSSNVHLHEKTPSGSRILRRGLTDRHDEKDKPSCLVYSGDVMLMTVWTLRIISEAEVEVVLGYGVA